MEIKERLARLRRRGWTQQAIADRLGVHFTTVSRWHTGTVTPVPVVGFALECLEKHEDSPGGAR
jgi:transcriptional regulator with XRE-family HTH domain